jgi:hypothetical protein
MPFSVELAPESISQCVGYRDCDKRLDAVSWRDCYFRMTWRLFYAVIHGAIFSEPRPEDFARVGLVTMDMNTAFDLDVRQHCPNVRVFYDLFHEGG